MNAVVKAALGLIAYDATIGAGNDSEKPTLEKAERYLGRPLSERETTWFEGEWLRNVQMMAQP